MKISFVVAFIATFCAGCSTSPAQPAPDAPAPVPKAESLATETTAPPASPTAPVDRSAYPWIADWTQDIPTLIPLEARFPAPAGFSRVEVESGSFGHWLRGLPVRTDRRHVLAYEGSPLRRPSAAVVFLDVGKRDLQQCADSAIRLHAEYLWHRGLAAKAAYHFTSGDRSGWAEWRRGERFLIAGSKVKRVNGARRKNDHPTYRGWLTHLFRYAGTRSLARDSDAVGAAPFEAGDFFVQPGGPGHAVMILDVATHPDGRRAALIGQGFMPAEDFHVVSARGGHTIDTVWFLLPPGAGSVNTPSWRPFRRSEARRFRTPGG